MIIASQEPSSWRKRSLNPFGLMPATKECEKKEPRARKSRSIKRIQSRLESQRDLSEVQTLAKALSEKQNQNRNQNQIQSQNQNQAPNQSLCTGTDQRDLGSTVKGSLVQIQSEKAVTVARGADWLVPVQGVPVIAATGEGQTMCVISKPSISQKSITQTPINQTSVSQMSISLTSSAPASQVRLANAPKFASSLNPLEVQQSLQSPTREPAPTSSVERPKIRNVLINYMGPNNDGGQVTRPECTCPGHWVPRGAPVWGCKPARPRLRLAGMTTAVRLPSMMQTVTAPGGS